MSPWGLWVEPMFGLTSAWHELIHPETDLDYLAFTEKVLAAKVGSDNISLTWKFIWRYTCTFAWFCRILHGLPWFVGEREKREIERSRERERDRSIDGQIGIWRDNVER